MNGDYLFAVNGRNCTDLSGCAAVVLPLQGTAEFSARDGTRRTLLAGRAVYFPALEAAEFAPDMMAGFRGLVVVLRDETRAMIQQGLPAFATSFDADPLILSLYPTLRPWLTMAKGAPVALEANHVIAEYVARRYGLHREALQRLPGNALRRGNIYRRLIEANAICENRSHLRISELGPRIHMSQAHFVRLFRSVFGHGPKQVLTRSRIARAMIFLAWTRLSISELAPLCGYQDRSAFSRAFASAVGEAPLAFRQEFRETSDIQRRFFQLRYESLRC